MMHARLHTKFIAMLVGAALVPALVVAGVILLRYQATSRADATRLASQVAATAAAETKTFIVSQFDILNNVASIYHPDFPIKGDVAERLLELTLLRSENFIDISVTDANGKEIVRKDRILTITPGDLRDRSGSEAYSAVRSNGAYVGPIYVQNGRPFFDIGRSIVDAQGNFTGAVFAQVDARVMPNVVADISKIVQPPGRVYIVNALGIVIAYPDISYVLSEHDLSNLPPVHDIVAGQTDSAAVSYVNENGDAVLGAAYPLTIQLYDEQGRNASSINWYVVAEQPQSAVYGEAQRAAEFSIALSLIAIFLAIILAIFFARRITRPIEALHEAATEFGKGNLAFRAKVESRDEIGELAQSFNTTAERLEDTVESLRAAERLTATERNKLQLILGGITNAVIAIDMQDKIILFNKAAELLTGYASGYAIGRPLRGLISLYDGEAPIEAARYTTVHPESADGPLFNKSNLRLVARDGEERYVNLLSGRIREGENDVGVVLTFQDVTREYFLDRTRREFVTIASHQLRTPLTALSWSFETLLSGAEGELSPQLRVVAERGKETNDRMIDLVNDLLDVSSIEEGRFGITLKRQSVRPAIEASREMMNKQAEKRGVALSYDLAEDLPDIDADVEKLGFVFTNLIDNAIKYTPAHGTVSVNAHRTDASLVITVRDSGIGIPHEEFDRVFTRFYRSDRARSYHTDGSGLGLYVAKNIVEQHHGTIAFESRENVGTTFTVTLPVPH